MQDDGNILYQPQWGSFSPAHTFIATSDIHLKHKLRMSRSEVIDAVGMAVGYARKYLDYVEFSAEDASRSDRDFLSILLYFRRARTMLRPKYAHDSIADVTGYLRSSFDWTNTKPDMRDRVIRSIAGQCETIEACTGSLLRAQQITWSNIGVEFPLEAACFRFDAGGWADDIESVLAVRKEC